MRKPRFAKQFIFWLNLEDESEYAIAETIEDLKDRRQFSKSIRDGLRLIVDLSQGRTDVLRELFPSILDDINSPPSSAGGNNDPTSSKSEIDALRDEIAMLRQAVLSIEVPEALHLAKQLTNHATPELTPTTNPKLDIKIAKSDDNSTQRVLNSIAALQSFGQAKTNAPPALPTLDDIEIEITEDKNAVDVEANLLRSFAGLGVPTAKKKSSGGMKKIDVNTELEVPNFDDMRI